MEKDSFYRLGKLIYLARWPILIIWLLLIIFCFTIIPHVMDPFKTTGFTDPHSPSVKADKLLNERLGYTSKSFLIIYTSEKLLATDAKFNTEIKNSLLNLKKITIPHKILYPESNKKQISADKHTAYVVILFKGTNEVDASFLKNFRNSIKKPPDLKMLIGGEPIFTEDAKKQTQVDLYKAEYIATPVAIITMLLVFGSVIAASLPILLGAFGAILILVLLYFIGHYVSLSVFTINIALLLGLCLSLDYALFIVSRFRDELNQGLSVIEAIAITQATAGKAVFFSALAVFISLSALLLFPIDILFSVGMGGLAAVSVSAIIALILLPAILTIINHKINSLPIKIFRSNHSPTIQYWHWFVGKVIRRPYLFFFAILTLLLFLSYPLLHINYGISDFRILPKASESRQVFDIFNEKFGENRLAPILVIFETKDKNILSKNNISALYDYSKNLLKDNRVDEIKSVVNTSSKLTKSDYQKLYNPAYAKYQPSDLKKFLEVSTNKNLTVMTVIGKHAGSSPENRALIKDIRKSTPPKGMKISVSGTSVNTIDVLKSIGQTFPRAFWWIVIFTYFILLILLRSIFLPLKAILTTILSLCASYGVLVFIIQYGHLHQLLNFQPQGVLDVSLLIIIFCALFGISMDYEVFLLSRIKECYEQNGDNKQSIMFGIERSSRIITSAAIIVILLCFSFMTADILIVKAFGLGIAVAVFVDAFLIRTILVPATMTIMGRLNWYCPRWLHRILIKLNTEHY